MKHLKKYKIFESSEIKSEIKDILCDIADNGLIIDSDISYNRVDVYLNADNTFNQLLTFKWNDVESSISELISQLSNRYEILNIAGSISLMDINGTFGHINTSIYPNAPHDLSEKEFTQIRINFKAF